MYYAISYDNVAAVDVDIYDGREQTLDWQAQGFELIQHQSAVTDWSDEAQLAETYYAEMEAEAKALTGCDHALIAGHILRNPEAAARHADFAAIQYVHSDFTQTYGDLVRTRYRNLEPQGASALARAGITAEAVLNAKRILILQFWRNVGEAQVDLPLALCDARSVPAEDLTPFTVPEYGGEAIPFDTFAVHAPAEQGAHRWFTFPNMGRDEAIAFRTYDSELAANNGRFWTPHSAFADPTPTQPEPRYSIEVRATCLFS